MMPTLLTSFSTLNVLDDGSAKSGHTHPIMVCLTLHIKNKKAHKSLPLPVSWRSALP